MNIRPLFENSLRSHDRAFFCCDPFRVFPLSQGTYRAKSVPVFVQADGARNPLKMRKTRYFKEKEVTFSGHFKGAKLSQ